MEEVLSFSFTFAILAMPFALIFASLLEALIKSFQCKSLPASALIESIFRVLTVGTMPKMMWIDAARIITGMANKSSLRDRAAEMLENQAMRQVISPFTIFAPCDLPISTAQSLSRVIPTSSVEIDFNSQEDTLPWQKKS